jgi:hypothetical protein
MHVPDECLFVEVAWNSVAPGRKGLSQFVAQRQECPSPLKCSADLPSLLPSGLPRDKLAGLCRGFAEVLLERVDGEGKLLGENCSSEA